MARREKARDRVEKAYQDGFDAGIEYMFHEIDKALVDVAMTHDERRGALVLHRWLCRQQEED